jgi:OOP family OmpA-OmpF porin
LFFGIFCCVKVDARALKKWPEMIDHHSPFKINCLSACNNSKYFHNDSLPKYSVDTVVIPFEYKQSALFQPFTFKAIDSVIGILLERDDVLLSINGYAHVDEAGDSICYYLSLNRALVIKDYVLGRGVDSMRITSLKGWGNVRSRNRKTNADILRYNCRAEIMLSYPLPPPPLAVNDRDEDGVADEVDECPDEYGEILKYGCPDKSAIIVPFEPEQFSLFSVSYAVLDSVKAILLRDPAVSVTISGYAYKTEGVDAVCKKLASERADIVRRYLLSRGIDAERILSSKGLGKSKSINAGRNPLEIIRNARAEISLIRR